MQVNAKVAGVALVSLIGFALLTTTVGTVTPAARAGATRVLVHRTGTGKASLGTFLLRTKLKVTLSCKGTGSLNVEVRSRATNGVQSQGTSCPNNKGYTTTRSFGPFGQRYHIYLASAPSKGSWTITIQTK